MGSASLTRPARIPCPEGGSTLLFAQRPVRIAGSGTSAFRLIVYGPLQGLSGPPRVWDHAEQAGNRSGISGLSVSEYPQL